MANTATGRATRRLGTPAARSAMISPSFDIRLSAINVPARTPNGIANGMEAGSSSRNNVAKVAGVAELLTRIENSGLAFCKKRTIRNSAVPRLALVATSKNITRERRPIELHFAAGGGGTSGGLAVSSEAGSSSISSNRTAGAIEAHPTT